MIEKIKKRVKAWKNLFAQGVEGINEDSSWREILIKQEYYYSSRFYPSCQQKLWKATETVGVFSDEELDFLKTLPAFDVVRLYLKMDDYRETFSDDIFGNKVYCMCLFKTADIPVREYTIVTDREDLIGLEVYLFKYSRYPRNQRHGIIRYAKEPPADYEEPKDADDLPF